MTLYNENDPKAAAWLRELIAAGQIAPGIVDERSVADIKAHELDAYTQCHFFAGIGGWSYALRLAGWSYAAAVWTGSCPCQPLSCAGQRKGHADERHLWPAFYRLIAECRPAIVFGEQVASPDGREWFAGVRADLEDTGYACGAADLCAAGVGAPHPRQRLYWMGVADCAGRDARRQAAEAVGYGRATEPAGGARGLVNTERDGRRAGRKADEGNVGAIVDAADSWSDFDICHFTGIDAGKARRVESGTFPLADGIPDRVGLLRGYGNAIVPQVAAEFVSACMESLDALAPTS